MVLGQSYQLTTDQLRRFDEEGYLVIEDLLTHEFLTELVDRVDGLIEGRYVAQNCIAGAASSSR